MEDIEFRYYWLLNNLQPFWAEENRIKSDNIKMKGTPNGQS